MDEWTKILVAPDTEIHRVIEMIDKNALQIALVADGNRKLLGTVTDGDIRRGILKGISLECPVHQIMNQKPVTIPLLKDRKSILNILKVNKLRHLPVVDEEDHIIGIEILDELVRDTRNDNWVIIMAGGRGKRLCPLTDNCPKPMLTISGKPILEIILHGLIDQGFHQFCISVNYKAEQIVEYFGDGSKWGVQIIYLVEDQSLGTAGPLSLFSASTSEPIIVMNGDILTKLNMEQLLDFHKKHQSKATVAVRPYNIQVPYGVIKAAKDRLVGFEEKPIYTSLVNAGVYTVDPEVISKIPKNSYYDMDQLFDGMLKSNDILSVFPIREYWIDIGSTEDFNQAQLDYNEVFNENERMQLYKE